jgi:hypothetical protein
LGNNNVYRIERIRGMFIVLLFLGVLSIICGITIKYKKWLWLHQGLIKRPVDIEKYTNYMGILDVVSGIIFIGIGVMFHFYNISDAIIFIMLTIYVAFTIYGEIKYRIIKH